MGRLGTVAVLVGLLWGAGMAAGITLGGLIHLLLALVAVLLLVQFLRGGTAQG